MLRHQGYLKSPSSIQDKLSESSSLSRDISSRSVRQSVKDTLNVTKKFPGDDNAKDITFFDKKTREKNSNIDKRRIIDKHSQIFKKPAVTENRKDSTMNLLSDSQNPDYKLKEAVVREATAASVCYPGDGDTESISSVAAKESSATLRESPKVYISKRHQKRKQQAQQAKQELDIGGNEELEMQGTYKISKSASGEMQKEEYKPNPPKMYSRHASHVDVDNDEMFQKSNNARSPRLPKQNSFAQNEQSESLLSAQDLPTHSEMQSNRGKESWNRNRLSENFKNHYHHDENSTRMSQSKRQGSYRGSKNYGYFDSRNDEEFVPLKTRPMRREMSEQEQQFQRKLMYEEVEFRGKNKEAYVYRHPYMYDSQTGYQNPYGKLQERESRQRIPKGKSKYYQIDGTVYDEDGEILYRVPDDRNS